MPNKTPVAVSEGRASFSDSFTGFGSKLSKILSNTSSTSTDSTLTKEKTAAAEQDRSRSRGRQEAFHSAGRGGAGNIRFASASSDARHITADGPDDFSSTRGREMAVAAKVTHSGRGGAGNIRSPSRDPASPTAAERDVVAYAAERDAELPHSSGRGGLGNIASARSRSRSRAADGVHSSGRGGAGNIVHGATGQAQLDDKERREYHVKEGVHSTGRGGAANLTSAPSPGIDAPPPVYDPHLIHSSGRGGAGNIREASRTRDASLDMSVTRGSVDGEGRGRTADRSGLGGVWDRVLSKERKE